MDQIRIKFINESECIKPVDFIFPRTTKIEDALIQFLQKTNSIIDLSVEKTTFFFKGKILNKSHYLQKSLSEIFKFENNIVKVMDNGSVIGGGGFFGIETIDISKNKTKNIGFSSWGPYYRSVWYGLNIQSKCKNKVVLHMKILFMLRLGLSKIGIYYVIVKKLYVRNVRKVVPLNFGFFNCKYEIEYEKIEDDGYKSGRVNGASGKREFIVFDQYSSGKASFTQLIFNITK